MTLVAPTGPWPQQQCVSSVNPPMLRGSAIDPKCSLVADLNY